MSWKLWSIGQHWEFILQLIGPHDSTMSCCRVPQRSWIKSPPWCVAAVQMKTPLKWCTSNTWMNTEEGEISLRKRCNRVWSTRHLERPTCQCWASTVGSMGVQQLYCLAHTPNLSTSWMYHCLIGQWQIFHATSNYLHSLFCYCLLISNS